MAFYSKIHNKTKGLKGVVSLYNYALKLKYMITQKAQQRLKILIFWEKHGLEATLDAFSIKERTLYNWKSKFKKSGKKLESLNDDPKSPIIRRKRIWPIEIINEIVRIRKEHPNLGSEKIHPELEEFCIKHNFQCPKPRTIARLIDDLGGLRTFPEKVSHFGKVKKADRKKVLRKPKGFKALYPGHLVAFDTIEEICDGKRRYIITFEDIYSRFGFALGTNSHASLAAKEFFTLCQKIFPLSFQFMHVLTDNGSEFKKHFSEELKRLHLIHYHTYPKTPKMNAHLERFNRTLQEEFSNYHKFDLFNNIDKFNDDLIDYLVWYNCKRVHYAFKNKLSPVQFMISLLENNSKSAIIKNIPSNCNLGWHYTRY